MHSQSPLLTLQGEAGEDGSVGRKGPAGPPGQNGEPGDRGTDGIPVCIYILTFHQHTIGFHGRLCLIFCRGQMVLLEPKVPMVLLEHSE